MGCGASRGEEFEKMNEPLVYQWLHSTADPDRHFMLDLANLLAIELQKTDPKKLQTQVLFRVGNKLDVQTSILNMYELSGAPLGSGAFWKVMGVKHRESGIIMAAKVLAMKNLQPVECCAALEQVIRELTAGSCLTHPRLTSILDVICEPQRLCLVMEKMNGSTLFHRLRKDQKDEASSPVQVASPSMSSINGLRHAASLQHNEQASTPGMTEDGARLAVRGVLEGLQYMHSKGFTHGDIKLENCLLEDQADLNTVKLCDFGSTMVQPLDSTLRAKSAIEKILLATEHKPEKLIYINGTVEYAAPEVLAYYMSTKKERESMAEEMGAQISSPCIDIWSTGVMMFTLLGGYYPFDGGAEDLASRMQAKRVLIMEFDKSLWQNISKPAKDIMKKMLEVQPNKRLSATELLKDVWFQNEEILATK
mmetsp:Transcript_13828/g.19007  ORF Transcript_13828/g.19007 Transcript_13828/m.19007 type:complete len:422 (-) Transcript_13828:297-1562(-)|eukprot:CAMPEP_0196577886 /NCGR_PEP_ID=MMETSP1081-20130531/6884_1 /TAXON_ID=36882 /ORGANISM="Pyramimonas amylifera, Strain CCMP720" /LENGTH=421 /DNA_ID=CAMNT_0041896939 /DNA_START=417 /DNA_END=1682 /DNA_ORIENTATION=+